MKETLNLLYLLTSIWWNNKYFSTFWTWSADSSCLVWRGSLLDLAGYVGVPHFEALICTFIWDQLHMPLNELLDFDPNVNVYTSAVAVYHTPSDICGIHGMAKECIHATPKWGKFRSLVTIQPSLLLIPIFLVWEGLTFPELSLFSCSNMVTGLTLAHLYIHSWRSMMSWMSTLGCGKFSQTLMPMETLYMQWFTSIQSFVQPIWLETDGPLPAAITHITALDMFLSFHVNKYIDHHAYEIAF